MYTIPRDGSWQTGPRDAEVRIVEFSDLSCPYSAITAAALQKLIANYPDRISLVFKHFPLPIHVKAPKAHAALMAAGDQGRFWEFRFRAAQEWNSADPDYLTSIASELGLDLGRFRSEMALDQAKRQRLDRDRELGAHLGIDRTPVCFINGVRSNDLVRDAETILLGHPVSPPQGTGTCH